MKNILLNCAAVVCLLTGCSKNDQQAPSATPSWTLYNASNSTLPDGQVNAIAIDKNDIKWIGTANGLVRIEGTQWTHFNTNNSILPSAFIQALAVQANGDLWAGTNNHGLAFFNGTNWKLYTTANSLLPSNAVMCLHHDAVNKKTWIGTAQGIVSVDANNQWQLFDGIAGEPVYSMATDSKGVLWLGTFEPFSFRGRIRRFDGAKWQRYALDELGYPSAFPYSVAVDKNDAPVALLTGTSVKTVIRKKGNEWEELAGPKDMHGLKTLLLEGEKTWVAGNGLTQFGTASQVRMIPGTDATILSIAADSKGNKWLGTLGGGLAVYAE